MGSTQSKSGNGKSPTLAALGAAQLPLNPSGTTSLSLHVVGAKPGSSVEIVPGKTFLPLAPENVNTIALAELVPAGDGTFKAVVRICPRFFTVSRRDLRKLNIPISEMFQSAPRSCERGDARPLA